MFLYLIAFVAALLTIFGLPCARNSLRDFSNNGYNQLLDRLLPAFRALLSLRSEEIPFDHETPGVQREEEQLSKADDVLAEGEAEGAQDVAKSSGEEIEMQNSTHSFNFDYVARKYDFNYANAEGRKRSFESDTNKTEKPTMVPQDMWNILQKTPMTVPERKNADFLFEALLQETIKAGNKSREEEGEDEALNRTRIIDEATFEKLLEEQKMTSGSRKS